MKKVLSIVFTSISFVLFAISLYIIIDFQIAIKENADAVIGFVIVLAFLFILFAIQGTLNIVSIVLGTKLTSKPLKVTIISINSAIILATIIIFLLLYLGKVFG